MTVSPEMMGIVRGVATLLAMLAFVGVAMWAYSRRRREKFDEAAKLPLEED
ncbi:MAG: cbb3-type cytochrome oxidase subunit 3 [Steroidobacteraceae bacterium]